MNSRNHIQEELEALNSALPSGPSGALYSVPDGYFEGLAAIVLERVKTQNALSATEEITALSPLLAGLSRQMPMSVPGDYFQSNIEVLDGIIGDEASTVLALIDKKQPYEVPAGYFTDLPAQVLQSVSKPKARVIAMTSRKWMRFAAAAVVAGVLTVAGLFYFGGKTEVRVDNPQWVASKLKNVSDKDLDEFVKTTDVSPSSTATATNKPARKVDAKNLLQDVSDKELDAFLDQVPTDDEVIAIN